MKKKKPFQHFQGHIVYCFPLTIKTKYIVKTINLVVASEMLAARAARFLIVNLRVHYAF